LTHACTWMCSWGCRLVSCFLAPRVVWTWIQACPESKRWLH